MKPEEEEALLEREITKLDPTASGVGRGITNRLRIGLPGQISGAMNLLPNDRKELEGTVDAPPASVLQAAFEVLRSEGKLIESEASGGGGDPEAATVAAKLGAGFLNLNPAVVTVDVKAGDGDSAMITIRGIAKEGLIKQHAGEEAAERVHTALMSALGAPPEPAEAPEA